MTATQTHTYTSTERHVLAAQVVGSFGLAAGGAAGGLVAVEITGDEAMAVLPIGLLALGAALLAPALTKIMAHAGQRAGLITGNVVAVLASGIVLVSTAGDSFPAFLIASFFLGAGNDAVFLSRYVVAHAAQPDRRGVALSRSLIAAAAGAVAGPILLGPSATLAEPLGLPPEAGLYVVAVFAFGTAAALLRWAPTSLPSSTTRVTIRRPNTKLALIILATANAMMVSVMSLAAVHLHEHGHSLSVVGMTVSLHVLAMFGGSPLTGRLVDRFGPIPVARVGAVLFAVAGVIGVLGDVSGIVHMSGALIALGLGWNIQMVAGSTLLTISVPDRDRFAVEGRGELIMGLAAAFGTLAGAGPLSALGGFRLLSAATLVASAVAAAWFRHGSADASSQKRSSPAAS